MTNQSDAHEQAQDDIAIKPAEILVNGENIRLLLVMRKTNGKELSLNAGMQVNWVTMTFLDGYWKSKPLYQ